MSVLPHEAKLVAILPLVRHGWLKWSRDKYDTICTRRLRLGFRIRELGFRFRVVFSWCKQNEATNIACQHWNHDNTYSLDFAVTDVIKGESHAFWTRHLTISNNCVCLKAKELQECCCPMPQNRHCQSTQFVLWMPWLQLPATVRLWEILTRAQFFFYVVAQVIILHNSHMLSNERCLYQMIAYN